MQVLLLPLNQSSLTFLEVIMRVWGLWVLLVLWVVTQTFSCTTQTKSAWGLPPIGSVSPIGQNKRLWPLPNEGKSGKSTVKLCKL